MEQLKKLIKKIVFFSLLLSASQTLLPAEEVAQGPEVTPTPTSLNSFLSSRAKQLKSSVEAGLSAGWQATKAAVTPVLRSQALKLLNMLLPNSQQNLRTVSFVALNTSSFMDKLMQALAIPAQPSDEELDANIATLKKELTELKVEFPLLAEHPSGQETTEFDKMKSTESDTTNADMQKSRSEFEKTRSDRDEMDNWNTAEKNISQEDISKAMDRLEEKRIERERIYNQSPAGQERADNKEKQEIEEAIEKIEAAKTDTQASELRSQLKQALNTGSIDIDLFTPEQRARSGLNQTFFYDLQASFQREKNKIWDRARRRALIKEITDAQVSNPIRAEELKRNLKTNLMSGAESIKTFGPAQLKAIGFDDETLKDMAEELKRNLKTNLMSGAKSIKTFGPTQLKAIGFDDETLKVIEQPGKGRAPSPVVEELD